MYRHILIPTDGSELAHKAVVYGLSLAKALGAQITALVVEPPFHVFDVYHRTSDDLPAAYVRHGEHVKAHAAKVLAGVADEAKAAGVACDTIETEHDHAYESIIATAKEKGCDLIVLASHGRSGLSAVVLGSVTNKVLTHSTIPVLVYR